MAKKISEEGVVEVELQKPKKDIFNDTIAQTRRSVENTETQTTQVSSSENSNITKSSSTTSTKSHSAHSTFSNIEDQVKQANEGKSYSEKVIDRAKQQKEIKLQEEESKKLEKEKDIDVSQKTDESLSSKSSQNKIAVNQKQQNTSNKSNSAFNRLQQRGDQFKHFSQDTIQKSKEKVDKTLENSKKVKKLVNGVKNVISFIAANWIPLLIALILVEAVIPFIIATSFRFGGSPHYYCDLLADKFTKKTEIYKRYCRSSGILQDVDENGVPMVPIMIQGPGNVPGGYYNFDLEVEDDSWMNSPFGAGTIHTDGCGLVALSMVASFITGEYIPPNELNSQVGGLDSGYDGMYHSGGKRVADHFGWESSYTRDINEVIDALENGNFVLAILDSTHVPEIPRGQWTGGGHYIMLIGIVDGKIAVADSNYYMGNENSYFMNDKQCWSPEVIDKAANIAPYTIIYTPDELK